MTVAEFRREMTVGELREALTEFPDYYPVVPVINGTLGVLTAVRSYEVDQSPAVLIGECDLPFDLVEALHTPPG